ncbi:hypothetical protein DRP04_06815 [Archaeoglobales archaeon]|nr:MAG: hypothetical protein B6U96_14575 [Archaeoglobales archaeon ex4484_92]RLI81121.1 MAG: hypothetical protein DRP04_06815 [Archaeoglobales archaeon]
MFYKMHERDLVLERLEKELAEKRKELEEIRKLLFEKEEHDKLRDSFLTRIKEDLDNLLGTNKKVLELESKILEIKKTVESLVSEITYIKKELREIRGEDKIKKEIRNEEIKKEEEVSEEEEEDLIICD